METLNEWFEKLLEAERLAASEAKDLINYCIKEFEAIGPEFKINWDMVAIDENFYEATTILGQTGFGTDMSGYPHIVVGLNRNMMRRGLEHIAINTIWHEFCHVVQFQEGLKNGFFYQTEPNGPLHAKEADQKLFNYYFGDDGHGDCWLKYADIVNNKLFPRLKIVPHADKKDIEDYFYANEENWKFKVYCPTCGSETTFLQTVPRPEEMSFDTYSGLLIIDSYGYPSSMPSLPCAYCGHALRIKFRDDFVELEAKMFAAAYMQKKHASRA